MKAEFTLITCLLVTSKGHNIKHIPSNFPPHPSLFPIILLPHTPVLTNQTRGKLQREQLYSRGAGHKTQRAERGSKGAWWVIALQTYTPGPGNRELLTGGQRGPAGPTLHSVYALPPYCRPMTSSHIFPTIILRVHLEKEQTCKWVVNSLLRA